MEQAANRADVAGGAYDAAIAQDLQHRLGREAAVAPLEPGARPEKWKRVPRKAPAERRKAARTEDAVTLYNDAFRCAARSSTCGACRFADASAATPAGARAG